MGDYDINGVGEARVQTLQSEGYDLGLVLGEKHAYVVLYDPGELIVGESCLERVGAC